MKLTTDWLVEGHVDFEYKKYVLLGYLQSVKKAFANSLLFPDFQELTFHYGNLLHLKRSRELMYEQFPKAISKDDFKKLKLVYKSLLEDDDLMKTVDDIMSFSIPHFRSQVKDGKLLFDEIESSIEIEPIGITPLSFDEGYVFFQLSGTREFKVYEYRVTIFQRSDENYRGLNMEFLEQTRQGLGETLESKKLDLVRRHRKMMVPAAFHVHSDKIVPYEESLLPVAKRALIKKLAA